MQTTTQIQATINKTHVAGMSFKGGRKDKFFLCLLEYYHDSERFFLKSLLQCKEDEDASFHDGNDAIKSWINKFEIKSLVVDSPLTMPLCYDCKLVCPGVNNCPIDCVVQIREMIANILKNDRDIERKSPKQYERDRNLDDEFDYSKDIINSKNVEHILSRSFKKRLKKGLIPYWNRAIDYWVWENYYDQLLKFLNYSYDSFGNTSLIQLSRFSYLRRHFPSTLSLYEGNVPVTLIELLRKKIISRSQILSLNTLSGCIDARFEIIKNIERNLNIFIYEHDLEILVKNIRAFDSFILAIVGQYLILNKTKKLPDWINQNTTRFVIPEL